MPLGPDRCNGPSGVYCLGVKKETGKLSLGLAYLTYFLDNLSFAYENRHKMTFLKGHLLRRKTQKMICQP
jgi:hypothetical protein